MGSAWHDGDLSVDSLMLLVFIYCYFLVALSLGIVYQDQVCVVVDNPSSSLFFFYITLLDPGKPPPVSQTFWFICNQFIAVCVYASVCSSGNKT